MAKRTAVAAPAAAIDDDLPWDKPKSDDDTANLFDSGGERGLADDANDEPSELEDRLRASLAGADASDLPARPEDPTTEILEKKPVGDILTDIALQGISGRMRKKPLPAHSNEWVVATYRRMAGLREVTADQAERSHFNMDCTLLKLSADRRGISVDDSEVAIPIDYEIVDEREPGLPQRIAEAQLGELVMLPIHEIVPDPAQARDEGADDELAELIKANGFYQSKPIEVRRHPDGLEAEYMIVDGERRYRGAVKAGHTHVPAMIVELKDEGARLLRQVVSNEGKRLKPMEEARTYKRIMQAKGWSIQQLADHLGKSKSTVSDRVAMADAPAPFQPLFEDGTLSAAAAPILRRLADLPEKTVQGIVDGAQRSWRWRNADEDGKTLPLKVLEEVLAEQLIDTLPEIRKGDQVAKAYTGPVITMNKRQYAADFEAFDRIQQDILDKATAKENAKLADAPSRPAKRERSDWEIRQAKAHAEARKKAEIKRLQVAAIVAKLPSSIDGKWAAFVVEYMLKEMHHDSRKAAFKMLGLEAKKTTRGVDFSNAIITHSDKLDASQRVKLILQLLLAGEIANSWSGGRIKDAAALAKVDLKKVKLPVEPKKKAAPKKSAKKGR